MESLGQSKHLSVMPDEVMECLDVRPGGRYIDATLGGGGHAAEILRRAGAEGSLLGLDRDAQALERAAKRLDRMPGRYRLAHGNHGELARLAAEHGFDAADGILMDLGVSSDQLDDPARGFSFMQDGPLDMRMNPSRGLTAAELLAGSGQGELADLLRNLGEEPRAQRIAAAIVRARQRGPVVTTGALAEIVTQAVGGRHGSRRHPATRTFQALRMAVNDELAALDAALEAAIACLKPGGRLVAIAFESLSDRRVKRCLGLHVGRMRSLQQGGAVWEGQPPAMAWVTRGALKAGRSEVEANPRARSARLRAARRLTEEESPGQADKYFENQKEL